MVETARAHSNQALQWTFERIERLKALWRQNTLSAGLIGRALGVTRNAVLGKVHRLKLESHRDENNRRDKVEKRQPMYKPRHVKVHLKPRQPVEPSDHDRDDPARGDTFLNLTFDDLRAGLCHYPDEGFAPPYRFCGQPTAGREVSYCPYHCRMAYHAPAPYRRDIGDGLATWRGVR